MSACQSKIEEFLYGNCDKVKRDGRGYVLRCPICGDSKKNKSLRRCHVDYYHKIDEWVYTCYNGDCPTPSGNIFSMYSYIMGVPYKQAIKELSDIKFDGDRLKDRLNGKRFTDDLDEKGDLDLVEDDLIYDDDVVSERQDIALQKQLISFKNDRRLNSLSFRICIAKDGRYKNRIIIPLYIDDKLVYFQGRSIFDWMQPKYLNPIVKKDLLILNRDKFDREKYIIVTEGLIDAFMVEYDQGTCCMGARMSDEFLSELFKMTTKGVIIALDNPDVDASGKKNILKLLDPVENRHAKRLFYYVPDDKNVKDLNDIRIKYPELNIYDTIVREKLSHFAIKMKYS